MAALDLHPFFYLLFLLVPSLIHRIHICILRTRFCREKGCLHARSREPVRDPFIGLDFIWECLFAKRGERYLERSHDDFQTLGSTYVSKRWTWETIYTCDARNIKHLLATSFEDYELPRLRISAMAGLLGSGIFTLNGHSWSVARGIMRTALARQDKEASMRKLERYFQAFLRRVPDGDGVDLQPLFFWLAMDFATEFLMGRSTDTLSRASTWGREEQFVQDYLACSTEIVKKMQLGPLQHFSWSPSAWRAKKRIFRYVDDLIDESLRMKEGRRSSTHDADHDILCELAAITTDRGQLRDQILHVLVAGRDTTACLLSNLFFVLARNPGVYAKLRGEVLSVAGEEPATWDGLGQMQYLKWCVQESLRIHPVIPTNARQATRDAILPHGGGEDGSAPLLVKKGTLVMYNVYSMHRNAGVFGTDPEEFVPERWSGLRPGWSYLPFNGGPRICIGQKFALLEAHFIVSRMVQVFERMEAVDDASWTELYALATTCRDGVKVRVTRAMSS